jgi:hypothetical protein
MVIHAFDDEKKEKDESKPRILSMAGDSVEFAFRFHPRSPIGLWSLQLQVMFKDGEKEDAFTRKLEDVYVLFNPWCKGGSGGKVKEGRGRKGDRGDAGAGEMGGRGKEERGEGDIMRKGRGNRYGGVVGLNEREAVCKRGGKRKWRER